MSIMLACIMTLASAFAPFGNGGAGSDKPHFITSAYAATSAEKQAEADAAWALLDEYQTELNQINSDYEHAVVIRTEAERRMIEAQAREDEARERIGELQDQLGVLAAQMYRNGPISYIEVFFGAKSFADFVSVIDMNNRINARKAELIAESKVMHTEAETARIEYTNQERIAAEKEAEIKALVTQKEAAYSQLLSLAKSLEKEAAELHVQEELAAEAARLKKIEDELRAAVGYVDPDLIARVPRLVFPFPDYVYLSSPFGWRASGFHLGVDFAGPSGADILAAASGTVTAAGWHSSMGNYIIISHGGGVRTTYMHFSALYVYVGTTVSAGQVIGACGTTGNSTGPHLHFQLEIDGNAVNPVGFF